MQIMGRILSWNTAAATTSTIDGTKMKPKSTNPLSTASPRRVRLNSSTSAYPSTEENAAEASTGNEKLAAAKDAGAYSPRRNRLNSRDIPRTYSGLYGNQEDLLPFELNRQTPQSHRFLIIVYLTLVVLVQLLTMLVTYEFSWTITNAVHLALTLVYIHWLKGSLYDQQGEMDHLTIWEQLEGTQDTKTVREVLLIVPTVLTYMACHFADYDKQTCVVNIVFWCVAVLAKLPFMNGVRLFGINRTAGIDDDGDDKENNEDKKAQWIRSFSARSSL